MSCLQNSSSSDSTESDWECSGAKQSTARKPHFSVTSSDTGLKLKIAAIPPRKLPAKKTAKPQTPQNKNETVIAKTEKAGKEKPNVKKKKSQLSESSLSSESCSKCSSDSSSEDDLPLKAVSKTLPNRNTQKNAKTVKSNSLKSDSDGSRDYENKDTLAKGNVKEKPGPSKTTFKKANKSDEPPQEAAVKRGRGRPRTKVSA